MREKRKILLNIPEYNGGGVYALIDENGKRYIGSSGNIYKRMKQHCTYMNTCWRSGRSGFLNSEMETAINNGAVFSCEILCKFSVEMSKYEREEVERVFLKKYGGIEQTYNFIPIRHKV